ncbi:TPA: EAL domain-containing protein [Burkholderia vietnamiensis]|nr:EAL domain-containing protein [Burkholderia vietnamiensis]
MKTVGQDSVKINTVAEQSGLIVPLGQWILRKACQHLAEWSSDPAMENLTLAVNVSSFQIRQEDFVRGVVQTLEETGANADRLVLELTESVLVDNLDSVASRMTTLGSHGISFALDDFGTGFSSLAYLQRLPLDELKIDQCFVRELESNANDLAIVTTIVALGRSMGLRVVAEGVETPAQRDALVRAGCHHFQGHLFGHPMPADDLKSLAHKQR